MIATPSLTQSVLEPVSHPHNLSAREQEAICRGCVRQIARHVGPTIDMAS